VLESPLGLIDGADVLPAETVVIPEAFTPVTLILGFPESPKEVVAKDAVDAVPVRFPTKLDAVAIPVTRIPLAFTFRTDEPVDTIVNWPALGEKNPVCESPTIYIDGDDADPGENETFVSVVIIPTLNGAASTH
jgi:hypothetical protein